MGAGRTGATRAATDVVGDVVGDAAVVVDSAGVVVASLVEDVDDGVDESGAVVVDRAERSGPPAEHAASATNTTPNTTPRKGDRRHIHSPACMV